MDCFRLLSEFSHFLSAEKVTATIEMIYAFPSPFGVLSFLIDMAEWYADQIGSGFRLLSEFSHFLFGIISP